MSHTSPPDSVPAVLGLWPSRASLAAALGVSVWSLYAWVKRGSIPSRWHGPIARVAAAAGIPLTAEDVARVSAMGPA